MEPMKPMRPMAPMEAWWPAALGSPSASGSQNHARYAFFPEKRRLLIEQGGKVATYDSGNHQISSVAQQEGHDRALAFTSQEGVVDLDELKQIS